MRDWDWCIPMTKQRIEADESFPLLMTYGTVNNFVLSDISGQVDQIEWVVLQYARGLPLFAFHSMEIIACSVLYRPCCYVLMTLHIQARLRTSIFHDRYGLFSGSIRCGWPEQVESYGLILMIKLKVKDDWYRGLILKWSFSENSFSITATRFRRMNW